MQRKVFIIELGYNSPDVVQQYGEYRDWIKAQLCEHQDLPIQSVAAFDGEDLPTSDQILAVILTGSGAMVTEKLPWSEKAADWLKEIVNDSVPIFGICYGHQLIAYALGGKVDYNPQGTKVGNYSVKMNKNAKNDPVFSFVDEDLLVHSCHRQSVIVAPANAQLLGSASFDENYILRYGENIWSVQFHPEFSVDIVKKRLEQYDLPPDQEIESAPQTYKIFSQFIDYARNLKR